MIPTESKAIMLRLHILLIQVSLITKDSKMPNKIEVDNESSSSSEGGDGYSQFVCQ